MKKIASFLVMLGALLSASATDAAGVLTFDFSDGTNEGSGTLFGSPFPSYFLVSFGTVTVTAGDDVGTYNVVANPNAPGFWTSQFGAFHYDNLVDPTGLNPIFDKYGIVGYNTDGGANVQQINLFSLGETNINGDFLYHLVSYAADVDGNGPGYSTRIRFCLPTLR
jgi:hypothetical protein